MNYILELLKAFDDIKADCCVSPINEENGEQSDQQQSEKQLTKQRAAIIPLIKDVAVQDIPTKDKIITSPSNKRYRVNSKDNGSTISITGQDNRDVWTVDQSGTAISAQNKEAEYLSRFFGAGEEEQGVEQGDEQGGETTLTPEQIAQQQEIDRVTRISANIGKVFTAIAGRFGGRQGICRLRLSEGMAKLKEATTKNQTAAKAYNATRAKDYCKAIEILKEGKMTVGFVSLISDVERQLAYNYKNTLLSQLKNIRTLSVGDIKVAFGKECKQPKGKKECLGLGSQEIAPQESEAAIKNFERATELMSLIGERELTAAEKTELQGLIEFTNDGMVLIRGETKWLAFKDRNRQFYDLTQTIQTAVLGDRKFKVHVMEDYKAGDDNNLRGKMKEHLHTLAGLIQQHVLADGNPEGQKDIDQAIKSVFSDLKDLCRYLKLSKDFVDEFNQGETAIPAESIPAFNSLTDGVANLDNCRDLTPQLYRELGELMDRVEGMGNPYVFQTGSVTGGGIRRDLVYAYESEEEALEGLSRDTGLPPEELKKYIQKRTVESLLGESPELTRALADDKLSGPGAKFDRKKVLFVIPEGIKSSLKGGPIKGGSGEEARTLEAATKPTKEQESWLEKTRSVLGISKAALPKAQAVLSKLDKDLKKDEATIMALGDKVVKGKKESPTAILQEIMDSRLGPNAENDLTYTTARALQKEFSKDPRKRDTKRIEELKKQLVVASQNNRVQEFYKKASGPRASQDQRHAMAILATMPGTTGEEMFTTIYDEQKRGEKINRTTIDHNEMVAGMWRNWLKDPTSATINVGESGPTKYFSVSLQTPDGHSIRTNYEGRSVSVTANKSWVNFLASKMRKGKRKTKKPQSDVVESILRIQTLLLRKILTG